MGTAFAIILAIVVGGGLLFSGYHGAARGGDQQALNAKQKEAYEVAAKLEGFDAAKHRFTIEDIRLGRINSPDTVLFVKMKSKNDSILQSAWWLNPIVDSMPKYNWNDFMRSLDSAEALVMKHAWIDEWAHAVEWRTLEAQVWGDKLCEGDMRYDEYKKAWINAGLLGTPTCRVLFRKNGDFCGDLLLGDGDQRALVLKPLCHERIVKHWLDQQFSINVNNRAYLIESISVDRAGQYEIHEKK